MKDLDSLSSSLLYAYLRSLNPPRAAFTSSYVPLLNIPASDILLRPEFTALFKHVGISASDLITLDDLPSSDEIENKLKPANTRWVLVDHNKLQGFLGTVYQNRIQGVVDHHEEENSVSQDTDPEPRVVEKCGSCSSLVLRTLKTTWDDTPWPSLSLDAAHAKDRSCIDASGMARIWDAQIAKTALASILIDTANLKGEGKVEPADREAVEYLEAKIRLSPHDREIWDRNGFYNEIDEAKKNIDSLKLNDILRKDYKEWNENGHKLGISSVVKSLDFLISKSNTEPQISGKHDTFSNALEAFTSNKNLSIFAIMTASTSADGTFQREIFLQSSPAHSSIISQFSQEAVSKLSLETLAIEGLSDCNNEDLLRKIWLQKDVSKSRKQVAPLLREAMR